MEVDFDKPPQVKKVKPQDNQVPFARMTAQNQKKHIAELVHSQYAEHAEELANAFPKLKKLHMDDGNFSFRTFGLFPAVETLKMKGILNPDPKDRLTED